MRFCLDTCSSSAINSAHRSCRKILLRCATLLEFLLRIRNCHSDLAFTPHLTRVAQDFFLFSTQAQLVASTASHVFLRSYQYEFSRITYHLAPVWLTLRNLVTLRNVVQSLNSPFFPPHIEAEPGRAKEESRTTCMHMLRTNQSKITWSQPRCSRQCVAQCLSQLAL